MNDPESTITHEANYLDSSGSTFPSTRANGAPKAFSLPLQINTAFDGHDFFQNYDQPIDPGPPYAVKSAGWQRAIDHLGLPSGEYHVAVPNGRGGISGYAHFKSASATARPTFRGKTAQPHGRDLLTLFKLSGISPETNVSPRDAEQFDTDHLEPRPPESLAWNGKQLFLDRQAPLSYVIRNSFDRMNESTGDTQDQNVSPPKP